MSNPYYGHGDGVPVYLSRGTSSPMQAEFDLVAAGFDGAYAAILLRGLIAGQAWTGTQNFTGATITVPTLAYGTSGAFAVNMDTLNAAVFAAANLPAQAGKADYFFTTDGGTPGVPSWTASLKATVIRFKDGADATKLMAFDLTGITTATTRTVAIPNKNGTMAMLTDMGLPAPLAVITPTAAATIDFMTTFSAAYDNYRIVGTNITVASDDSIRFRAAAAGSADTGSNYFSQGDAVSTAFTTSATSIQMSQVILSAGKGASFMIEVLNANDATNLKIIHSRCLGQTSLAPGYVNFYKDTAYIAANSMSGFRLFTGGGANFGATGKIRVYGWNNT